MTTIAERHERRHARAVLMKRIAQNPRLAQCVAVCQAKDKQRVFAERVRKRK